MVLETQCWREKACLCPSICLRLTTSIGGLVYVLAVCSKPRTNDTIHEIDSIRRTDCSRPLMSLNIKGKETLIQYRFTCVACDLYRATAMLPQPGRELLRMMSRGTDSGVLYLGCSTYKTLLCSVRINMNNLYPYLLNKGYTAGYNPASRILFETKTSNTRQTTDSMQSSPISRSQNAGFDEFHIVSFRTLD